MTEKRKFRLKKLIDDPPEKKDHRFSSKEGGKIVVHSKRQSQQITPHVENAHATLTRKKRKLTRPRTKWKTHTIVISVFLSIVAVAGIVLLVHYYQVKKLEERTEAYMLQQAHIAAEETLPGFSAPLKVLGGAVARADGLMSNVADTVQFVTDRPLEQFISSAARRKAWLMEQQTRAAADAAKAAATEPSSSASDESAAEEQEEPEAPVTINGRDAPMGFETEHVRPRRKRPKKPTANRDEPELPRGVSVDGRDAPAGIDLHRGEDGPGTSSSSGAGSRSINFDTDPDVVKLARKAKSANESIQEHHNKLKALHQQALDLNDEAQAARLSTAARQKVTELEKLVEDAEDLAKRGEADLVTMNKLTDQIRRVGLEEKQKRAAAAEAERKRKEAEAYRALVARERNSVKQSYESIKPLIPVYDFAGALDRLMFDKSQLTTKEAISDSGPFLDRIKALADTKQDMIANLNRERYRWGWGKGTTALDIIGADADTLWIPGRKIPWSEVPLPQFAKILRHYVDQPQDKLSIRSKRALAMAILFSENDMAEQAAELAALAVQLTDTTQADVDRLLPDL